MKSSPNFYLSNTELVNCSIQVAVPDVVEAAKDADLLIFVVPHQFVRTLCSTLLGRIKPTAAALSLIKVHVFEIGELDITCKCELGYHFADCCN